jgi:hypothetical protein
MAADLRTACPAAQHSALSFGGASGLRIRETPQGLVAPPGARSVWPQGEGGKSDHGP